MKHNGKKVYIFYLILIGILSILILSVKNWGGGGGGRGRGRGGGEEVGGLLNGQNLSTVSDHEKIYTPIRQKIFQFLVY